MDIDENKFIQKDQPLTGSFFGMQPRDMVYLFFLIEKEFNLRIEISEIVKYEFCTIRSIEELLKAKLEKRNE